MALLPYLFLDTNALLKRYVAERGSDRIQDILARPETRGRLFVAAHIEGELISKLNRDYRAGRLGLHDVEFALAQFKQQQGIFAIVPLSDEVLHDGHVILNTHRTAAIGSGDAYHLGALRYAARTALRNEMLVMVSADRALRRVCDRLGIRTYNPETEPLAALDLW